MRTIKLIIQYDGTNYCGWQEQTNGISIQETVELALAKILGKRVRIQSSGRTDSGVHAVAMPAVFKTDSKMPLKAFVYGLNCYLPEDIAIQSAEEVPSKFKPIGGARSKTYRYTIYNCPIRSPLNRLTSWHVRETIDTEAMIKASEYFIGEHDFAGFRGQNCTAVTSIRRVDSVIIKKEEPFIIIDVTGGGFLKYMVRIMVGTLVDIGRGKLEPAHIKKLLEQPIRANAGVTAPPQGLSLLHVLYLEK